MYHEHKLGVYPAVYLLYIKMDINYDAVVSFLKLVLVLYSLIYKQQHFSDL
jgi:hypothetical protein